MDPNAIARLIVAGHIAYHRDFDRITRGARARFEQADWLAVQRASTLRIEIYDEHVSRVVARISRLRDAHSPPLDWTRTKAIYASLIEGLDDYEIAETFFNSTRTTAPASQSTSSVSLARRRPMPLFLVKVNLKGSASVAVSLRPMTCD